MLKIKERCTSPIVKLYETQEVVETDGEVKVFIKF